MPVQAFCRHIALSVIVVQISHALDSPDALVPNSHLVQEEMSRQAGRPQASTGGDLAFNMAHCSSQCRRFWGLTFRHGSWRQTLVVCTLRACRSVYRQPMMVSCS